MRPLITCLALCLFLAACCSGDELGKWKALRKRPYRDVVPDAQTAVLVAEAVMSPVYGRRYVVAQRPQIATLRGGVWHVHGSSGPPGTVAVGGTIEAYIDKHTGRVLAITDGGE